MSDLTSILPPNHAPPEAALEQALHKGDPDLAPIPLLMQPANCPSDLLLWLAWSLSVDVWDDTWPEETKRNVIASSLPVHRRKGTLRAVKDALAAAGYGDAEVIERFGWQLHDGTYVRDGSITRAKLDHWAEYRITLARPITIKQAAFVREILENVAPARSHLKALDFTQALHLHNDTITRDGTYTRGVA